MKKKCIKPIQIVLKERGRLNFINFLNEFITLTYLGFSNALQRPWSAEFELNEREKMLA